MENIDIKNLGFTDKQLMALGFDVNEHLIFGKWSDKKMNRNHYYYRERDIICKECSTKITKLTSWIDFDNMVDYEDSKFKNFNNCPYCGAKIK